MTDDAALTRSDPAARPGASGSTAGAGGLALDSPWRLLAVAYAGVGVVLLAAAAAGALFDRPYNYFTRDPVQALADADCSGRECIVVGMISNVGVLVWSAGAVAALLVAAVLWPRNARSAAPFLAAGAITLVLAADDLFGLHEEAYWQPWPVEQVLLALYGAAVLAFLLSFRRFLARTSRPLVAIALGFFALSVVADRLFPGHPLVEDGSKLFGIATWSTYLVGTSILQLRRVLERG